MCFIGNGFVLNIDQSSISFLINSFMHEFGKRLLGDKNFMHHMESWRRGSVQKAKSDLTTLYPRGQVSCSSAPARTIWYSDVCQNDINTLVHPSHICCIFMYPKTTDPCKDDWDYGGINIMLSMKKKPLNAAVFFCDSRYVFFDPDSLVAPGVYMSFTHPPKPC